MDEEFQKREVLFPQEHELEFQNPSNKKEAQDEYDFQIYRYNNKVSMIRKVIMKQDTNSIAMNKASLFNEKNTTFFKEEYVDDDGEMMPPHIIIKRRIARRMMTF
ncbi:hypothetical protein R3W88_033290 [Solanum pinnatisectum]|uniref:Translocon at the inner envelope membrane of chloroplasts 214 n=1 Tax=Solanum pinnatisectum TaxID=50273 RepID=A0AAV9K1W5_9SOLN|nr:hypothetical protein R3W88_033290 [Solanum pinnatisectum]